MESQKTGTDKRVMKGFVLMCFFAPLLSCLKFIQNPHMPFYISSLFLDDIYWWMKFSVAFLTTHYMAVSGWACVLVGITVSVNFMSDLIFLTTQIRYVFQLILHTIFDQFHICSFQFVLPWMGIQTMRYSMIVPRLKCTLYFYCGV